MQRERIKNIIIISLGLFFIFFGAFAIDYAIWREKPEWAFWICYVAMVLIGFGALLRLPSLIASQVAIVFMPLAVWNIDFFYQIIFGQKLWGLTDYFFGEMLPAARFISLEHFFLIPLGLLLLFMIKLNQKTFWVISAIQMALLYGIIRFFTRSTENVNCVFQSCGSTIFNGPWPLNWLGLTVGMIAIASIVIMTIPIFHHHSLNNGSK